MPGGRARIPLPGAVGTTPGPPSPTARERRLRAVYAAFNARDVDAVLAEMAADVDWPNAWEGGRVHGHRGVRDYWSRQWASIDSSADPMSVIVRADGSVAVEVHQRARDLGGALLSEGRVVHVYRFRDGLVVRMDVEEAADGGQPQAGVG